MIRREPQWNDVDSQDDPDFDPSSAIGCFRIELSSRVRERWGEVRASAFNAEGTLCISDSHLTLDTSSTYAIGVGRARKIVLANVYNARASKKLVFFDIVDGPGELEHVVLRAHDASDSASIVAALPAQMTRPYAEEDLKRRRFAAQSALTPFAWGTWSIIALTTIVFIAMWYSCGTVLSFDYRYTIAGGSNYGPYTIGGEWWRLLTSVFIHFGILHWLINMLVLAQMGRVVERAFGTPRFVAIYVISGVIASLASLIWHYNIQSAGASGAIFGVLGALVAYVLRYRSSIPRSMLTKQYWIAVFYLVSTLVRGISNQHVDNADHVGGLLVGLVLGYMLAPPLESTEPTRERPAMTFLIAGAFACLAVTGLTLRVLQLAERPDRRQTMYASRAIFELGADVDRAERDLRSIAMSPPMTATGRSAYVLRIRSIVLPEWSGIDQAVGRLPIPSNPDEARARTHMLRYFDDKTQTLVILANAAGADHLLSPGESATVTSLIRDATMQMSTLHTGH
ncbi:rhomboid protease GluP [Pararobbsia alpina]|uniref:rhomboid family intramembrane serine protease n=1 Tax=Pararobbsia alpina TaxID=621374 RepID=UPI0039A4CF6A